MKSMNMNLEKTREEITRLAKNHRALLDAMPEMVFLVNERKKIEYMNPSALIIFGDLCHNDKKEKKSDRDICVQLITAMDSALANPTESGLEETALNEIYVEFSVVPFTGYEGDKLLMLILRDVSDRKQHEKEMLQFHANIETILSHKINELQESERVRRHLSTQLNTLKHHLKNGTPEDEIVGSSKVMRELKDMVFQVAKSNATILINGESGTGKELVANLIRETSDRNNQPFLKINCTTINDSLLESDLFGYEKGAFTGATTRKKGKFEVVDGGTIFLDEIGDISPRMQAALLRILQNGEIVRVGGNTPIHVDVRIIAATNLDLAKAVKDGKFRLDLYYRLNIITISMPPLRERKDDIIELVTFFIKRYRETFKKDINFLPKPIMDKLIRHEWPGNVRELENVIQRAVLMAKSNIITENELMFNAHPGEEKNTSLNSFLQKLDGMSLKNIVAEFERDVIIKALEKQRGNVSGAAKTLQIGKTACYDKMKRYDISAKGYK